MTSTDQALSESARRIYFEQLGGMLLSRGIDGAAIGEVVAELDDHVAASGASPVEELGPAGELADALAESMSTTKTWLWFGAGLLLSVTVAVALASVFALIDGPQPGSGDLEFPMGFMTYIALFAIALQMVNLFKSRSVIGTARLEKGMWKLFLPMVAVLVIVNLVTKDWVNLISTGAGWTLALLFVPATIVLGWLVMKRSKVTVPGGAAHLNRLNRGVFGSKR